LQTVKEEIIERYNKTVALYRRILQIHITTETLPRTRLGKMRRFMLQDFFVPTPENEKAGTQDAAIADDTLRALCEYLGRKKNMAAKPESRLDFDLTLDSLDRLELASFVQTSFGRTLSETDIAQAKSIADVAVLVQNATHTTNDTLEKMAVKALPKLRKNNRSLMRSLVAFTVRRGFRLRTEGLEHLPEDKPCILVANHESYLDIPCLIATLPKTYLSRTITWVKASPIMEKVVRFMSRGKNIITVHAKKPLSVTLRASELAIEAGHNLVIFPEGLRSRNGEFAPFRPGFAIIACKMKVPVIPIAIEGTYEAMPRGRLIPRFGRTIKLTVTPPLMPLEGESDSALAQRAHDKIAEIVAPRKD
jgi:long-chain acyl-CoA synthetase